MTDQVFEPQPDMTRRIEKKKFPLRMEDFKIQKQTTKREMKTNHLLLPSFNGFYMIEYKNKSTQNDNASI
jgi:hypothetical protein